MSGANSWLQRQRKSELVEIAQNVGLKDYDGLKKTDLELQLDDFLSENTARFSSDSKLSGYYNSRARMVGSPIKREAQESKPSRRRTTKVADEIVATDDDDEQPPRATTSALVRTPARSLNLASRIPLPPTPRDVAQVVDRSTLAVRTRVSTLYGESGIGEATQKTRQQLSTVSSVLLLVHTFELFFLRPAVLPNRYAFTIPSIPLLGLSDYSVHLPDLFQLLSSSFWSPALLYTFTSILVPCFVGYFINLNAANEDRVIDFYDDEDEEDEDDEDDEEALARASRLRQLIDPVTFSIVKAILTYVVYNQGATFGGLVDPKSVAVINSALYGGWKGVITGSAVTGFVALYDAVLKR